MMDKVTGRLRDKAISRRDSPGPLVLLRLGSPLGPAAAGGQALSPGRWLAVLIVLTGLMSACDSQAPAPNSTRQAAPTGQMTSRAFIPSFNSAGSNSEGAVNNTAQRRVLFIQGDHVPESGYSHSRVRDDGGQPESFTHLRADVLEGDLKLAVDEVVLTKEKLIDQALLGQYTAVVLGSNARALSAEEAGALQAYFMRGGSLLVYADSQYGPNNWTSDNGLLSLLGIEVLTDNFQPAVDITDLVTTHPLMAGVKAIRGEGLSQFRVSAAAAQTGIQVLAKCSPLTRSGCTLPPADQTKVQPDDTVACVITYEVNTGGRFAGVCDRNLFQNGPGPGSDLDQADDRTFARNLFQWLAKE
jgi:hypothetical protein